MPNALPDDKRTLEALLASGGGRGAAAADALLLRGLIERQWCPRTDRAHPF